MQKKTKDEVERQELLAALTAAEGVSGNEKEVRAFVRENIKEYVDDLQVDHIGNLVAKQNGDPPSIVLSAHLDEVGLMIQSITGDGLLNFSPLGWIDPITIVGQKVEVENLNGVITCPEIASGEEMDEVPAGEDLHIDVGLDEQEAHRRIDIGSYVTLDHGSFRTLGEGNEVCAKALDDRIGCFVLIELARRLDTDHELSFVFTVQEEIGMYGSRVSSHGMNADYGIVVDMVDQDFSQENRVVGQGPCLTIKDGGVISNPCLNEWIKTIARNNDISMQYEVSEDGVTDALNMALAQGGMPVTTLGVPVKNMHTTDGIASWKDIRRLTDLLLAALEDPVLDCKV